MLCGFRERASKFMCFKAINNDLEVWFLRKHSSNSFYLDLLVFCLECLLIVDESNGPNFTDIKNRLQGNCLEFFSNFECTEQGKGERLTGKNRLQAREDRRRIGESSLSPYFIS